ncbi:hypothetical protein F4604DRAFT_1936148 [Suillus subluteus]|nr:hypothetical protein F4604DRAFT_1936148 [Suillus subluteus]
MTPGAGGFFERCCRASDHVIIGHMKAHVYNTMSLATVEQTFKATEGDQEHTPIEVLDVSSSDVGEEKDALKSLKAGLIKQVADLGGKFVDRPFPWILMPSSLANDHLRIEGYPTHLSLMPGESHNSNSRSKGVAGLTQREVNVLALALKAKTMRVVKVTKAIGVAVIASKEPVIIGEAPPANSPFPNARRMFVNGTFDYQGPARLQPSSATTKKKKPKVPSSRTQTDGDTDIAAMDSTTAIRRNTKLRPEVVIPPSRPFKLAKCPPTKPVVIEVRSSPDGVDEPCGDDDEEEEEEPLNGSGHEIPSEDDKDFDDFSCSQKRKLKAGGGAQATKKHVQSIEELEGKVVIGKKPSVKVAGKAHAKGGRSSPVMVESSGDEQQSRPTIDNAAKRICDGPPDVQKVPRARPVPKGKQPVLTKSTRLLQEDKDLQNNDGAVHPETSADHPSSAQVMETPTLPAVPSPAHSSDHPAELAPDDGQSVLVPDAPLPLPQNLLQSSSEDTRLSPSLSGHNVPDSHHANSRGADNTHLREPHDNWHLHNRGQSREARNDICDLPLNDGHDLHPRRDNSPALHDDRRHPNDDPRGAYMYHEDLDRHAYTRRPQPGGDYPYHREYPYYSDQSTGYRDATGYGRSYYRDARYPDHEFLDDRLCGPPPLDIHGEYIHPTSREGHAGYERAYQRQPPRGDGRHNTRSPIANMPLTLPGQVTEQEQREGAAI